MLSFVYNSVTVKFNEKCKCNIRYKSLLSYVCHRLVLLVNDFVTLVLNGPVIVAVFIRSADIQTS